MTQSESRIVMVGVFPPPVHGVAAVNAAMRARLRDAGAGPEVLDISAPSLDRALAVRLGRLPKVVRGLARLSRLRSQPGAALYISVSGGWGQVYEILFVALARLLGMRIYLHHHSYAYLDRRSRLFWLLARLAGRDTVHFVLTAGMARTFERYYGARRAVAISNCAFLDFPDENSGTAVRARLRTLGYLSNIAEEKGVHAFLDLIAEARDSRLPVRGVLAGPFQDSRTERRVRDRLAALGDTVYVGPKYGLDKYAFLDDVDVLVFPTKYRNEAEPLVIHEAMSRNVPVIAYGRGCIPEIVGPECGRVIDPAEPFVPAALEQIRGWLADPGAFAAASRAAGARFRATREANLGRLEALIGELTGRGASAADSAATAARPTTGT